MEAEVLTMLLGIALAALVAACGAGFKWMRTDFRDLRSHIDSRFTDHITTTNERFAEVNGRLDRLENRFDRLENRFDRLERRFDDLIMALASAGLSIEPRPGAPPPPPAPRSPTGVQPPESAPAPPTEASESRALPAETLPKIADPPRAPPTTRGQPSADHPARRAPPEPFGPTAAPA